MPISLHVETTTPLTSGATYTGAPQVADSTFYSLPPIQMNFFTAVVFANQLGAARIEQSPDNITWTRVTNDFVVMPSSPVELYCLNTSGNFYRVVVVNGTTAQSSFRVESGFTSSISIASSDGAFTGPAGLAAINADMITGVTNGWIDVSQFNSCVAQLVGSAGISAGAVTIEGTNDISQTGAALLVLNAATSAMAATFTLAASTTTLLNIPINTKFIRVRISTAFVGGTVQGFFQLSQRSVVLPTPAVAIATTINNDNMWFQDSVAAQAANATVTGSARDVGTATAVAHRYSAFNLFAFADQAGTVRIEVSNDNTNWRRATTDTVVAANTPVYLSVPVTARYHRAVYVNGATVQTVFLLNTSLTAA